MYTNIYVQTSPTENSSCVTNTFGTPGADEHAFFVRNVADAKRVQHRLQQVLELASLPGLTDQEQRDLLHIVVVGGGPTGVEIAAEMSDLFNEDFSMLYPDLRGKMSITIHDAASFILGAFEHSLQQHAIGSFSKRSVQVVTESRIKEVTGNTITTEAEGLIPCGMVIWTAGNKQCTLVDGLQVAKTDKLPRIMTDDFLHALSPDKTPMRDVFALGDAADIKKQFLPTTAEVAVQKAEYLARMLNTDNTTEDFLYRQKALVAYIGGHDGVVHGKPEWSGTRAWAAWRSKNLLWTRSWRRKFMITIYWFLDWYVFLWLQSTPENPPLILVLIGWVVKRLRGLEHFQYRHTTCPEATAVDTRRFTTYKGIEFA